MLRRMKRSHLIILIAAVLGTILVEVSLIGLSKIIMSSEKGIVHVPQFTPYRLYVNHVSESASQTLIALLETLKVFNNFKRVSSTAYDARKFLDLNEQVRLVKSIVLNKMYF